MLKYFISIFICCTAFIAADFEEHSIETLASTFQAFEERGGDAVWPRFKLSDLPTVFHFNNGHLYAFGLKGALPLWENRLIQQCPVLYCPAHSCCLAPLDSSFTIENQQAFVFCLDHMNDKSELPLLTFIHERFHLHQFHYFRKQGAGRAVASDYQTVEQFALMELENRLLVRYLKAEGRADKINCLKDFIAVSQTRRLKMHPASVKWENHQQMMEGLADYVSVKTFQIFPSIATFHVEKVLLDMRHKKTARMSSLMQDGRKGRHYLVGAVLALALDECSVKDWKLKVEAGSASLLQLIESKFALDERERGVRLGNIKHRLDWNGIKRLISQKFEQERKEKDTLLAAFTSQEGITISMGLPSGHMSAGGRHEKSCHIGHGSTVIVNDVSTASSQDQTWELAFHGMPLIIENQKGERLFKIDPGVILTVDEKPEALRDLVQKHSGKKLPFSTLSLQDKVCVLSSTRPGKMMVQNNVVSFVFD